MLPTSNPRSPARRKRAPEAAAPVVFEHQTEAVSCDDPLHPIGCERLAALREAIRNGTYPTDAEVLGGLEAMLTRDED